MSFSEAQALGWRRDLIRAQATITTLRHRIEQLEGQRYQIAAAERDRVRGQLREHYLADISAIRHENRPSCACGDVDLGWHPSAESAVEEWLEHALGGAG